MDKKIKLIGGTSWPSTQVYYQKLNELANAAHGGFHSANLLIRSIDYHNIKSNYGGDWAPIKENLKQVLQEVDSYPGSCMLICNNTLHKAYFELLPELHLTTPVISITDAVIAQAKAIAARSVLFLAVKFTMEDPFYVSRLEESGLEVLTPTSAEMQKIYAIQARIAKNQMLSGDKESFTKILQKYSMVDGVVLACTEFSKLVDPGESTQSIIDSVDAHCKAAFAYTEAL